MKLRKYPMSGYDVISFAHKKFKILLSPGTVYSSLYSLERGGLVKGENIQGKRVYTLTEHGKETVRVFSQTKDRLLGLISNLFIG
jgi:DNA-binding PadR family transcriptional regulator